jgi:hypothetical protein
MNDNLEESKLSRKAVRRLLVVTVSLWIQDCQLMLQITFKVPSEALIPKARDAYGPEEQAMGWYYYLENKIRFPFQAKCIVSKVTSPLRKGEPVDVRGLAPEDRCSSDMLVLIRWQGRTVAVPLSQLTAINPDESTCEAINDWHLYLRLPKTHDGTWPATMPSLPCCSMLA